MFFRLIGVEIKVPFQYFKTRFAKRPSSVDKNKRSTAVRYVTHRITDCLLIDNHIVMDVMYFDFRSCTPTAVRTDNNTESQTTVNEN